MALTWDAACLAQAIWKGQTGVPSPWFPHAHSFPHGGSGFILQLGLWSAPSSSQRGVQCTFLLQRLTFTRNKNKAASCSCWWHSTLKDLSSPRAKLKRLKKWKAEMTMSCSQRAIRSTRILPEASLFAFYKVQYEPGRTFTNRIFCYCSLKDQSGAY